MRISGNSRAFTMVELMAAICIVFVLVFALVTYVPQVIDWARQTSDRQTLTVLNDALSRYKTEGGSVGGLNPMTPISQVLTSLQTAVTWGGYGHQFLHGGVTYTGRSLSATGHGAQYRFTRYNYYTAEPGISDLGPTGGSLVGWWKFDEGSGTTAADSSGKGLNGSFTGATWVVGHNGTGSALQFNKSGYVGCGNACGFSGLAPLSVSCWIFINSYTPLTYGRIVAKESGSGSTWQGWHVEIRGSASDVLFYRAQDGNNAGSVAVPVSVGQWQHIAITFDGTTMKFYRNGALVNSATTSTPIVDNAGVLGIGGGSSGNLLDGAMLDDVRIYSRALTGSEVAALYGQ